jgi:hypothetical protein
MPSASLQNRPKPSNSKEEELSTMSITTIHPHHRRSERGQALLFFALTGAVLLGMLGLVIDTGWAYYINRKAQTAADAAALAAVRKAAEQVGAIAEPACGTIACQASAPCPSVDNLQVGCQYAAANGFAHGGDSGRQKVEIAASDIGTAPGVSSVPVDYWVQVRTEHQLPALFSRLFMNNGFKPSVRSTAALRRVGVNASLLLLNRSTDCFASLLGLGVVCGEDFLALGLNKITAENGIYMASSNGPGLGLPQIAAGTIVGSIEVDAPYTYLRGKGAIQNILAFADWNSTPVNGLPDSEEFSDPMAGKGQPPMPTGLPDRPVSGGIIIGSLLPGLPTVLPPGKYYSTTPNTLLGPGVPTGLPITILGNVTFSDGAGTPCGGFCNYVFYGGVVTGALSTVTFSPGRYVFAGAQPVSGGPGVGLTVGLNSVIKDRTPLQNGQITRNTDAGEIFIFTDSNFPGLQLPVALSSAGLSFPQVKAGIATGLNPQITLHGLNKDSAALPASLVPFAPVLIWQDQNNTTLKYNSNGTIDFSCGGPCTRILSVPGSQEMILTASQWAGRSGTNLYGTVYAPRGAWTTILGLLPGDTVAGPLQIITGALQMTLNSGLDLKALPNPQSRLVAALIQ